LWVKAEADMYCAGLNFMFLVPGTSSPSTDEFNRLICPRETLKI